MRKSSILWALMIACGLAGIATAQDQPSQPVDPKPVTIASTGAGEVYRVSVTEVQFQGEAEVPKSGKDFPQLLEQLKQGGKVKLVETIQMSALTNQEAMAQFGRTVDVLVGMNMVPPGARGGGGGPSRITSMRQVGTLLKVTIQPEQNKLHVKLMYEASRMATDGPDDRPQEMTTNVFGTTLLVEPGMPILIGSRNSDKNSLIYLVVEK